MVDLIETMNHLVNTPSDINEHLMYLKELADTVQHVTEFGVRDGVSSVAFLNSNVALRSYDIFFSVEANKYFDFALDKQKDVKYIICDVLDVDIEPTDLLFIDTFHNHDQVLQELRKHAPSVRKYIVLHDTTTFGRCSEPHYYDNVRWLSQGSKPHAGVLDGVEQFLLEDSSWTINNVRTNNNGLTTLIRM